MVDKSSSKRPEKDILASTEEHHAFEVLSGETTKKAVPSAEHGTAQRKLGAWLEPYDKRPGGGAPGGWWLMAEVEVQFAAGESFCPDLVGWRRERIAERPRGSAILLRPDWIGEILLPSNAVHDRVRKLNIYHRFKVPNYWVLDPAEQALFAYKWTDAGYLLTTAAALQDRVKIEPFDAFELHVAAIFGHED